MVGFVYHGQSTLLLEHLRNEQIPDFQIKQGTIRTSLEEAKVIELDGATVVFDTSNVKADQKLASEKNTLYVLRDRLILQQTEATQTVVLSQLPVLGELKITKAELIDRIEGGRWLLFVAVGGFIFTLYYLMLLLICSLLMFIGLGLNVILQHRLKMSHVWCVASYAITIPTMVCGALNIIGYNAPFTTGSFVVYMLASTFILYLVLREISYRPSIDSMTDTSGVT
jgi:hypothetical protein